MKEVRIPVRDLKIVSIEEFKGQGGQLISNIVKETNAPVQVTLEELEESAGGGDAAPGAVPPMAHEKDLQEIVYDLHQEHINSVKTSLLYTLLDVLMSADPIKQGKKSLDVADNLIRAAFPAPPHEFELSFEYLERTRRKEVVWTWYKAALELLSMGKQARQLKKALEFQPKEDKNGMKRADRLALWLNVKMEVGESGKVSSSTEFYPGTTKSDSFVIVLLSWAEYPEAGFGEGELVTPNVYWRTSKTFPTASLAIQARATAIIKGELSSKYSFIVPMMALK